MLQRFQHETAGIDHECSVCREQIVQTVQDVHELEAVALIRGRRILRRICTKEFRAEA